jgi:hypothetical protein
MRNHLVTAAASACLLFASSACSDSTGPTVSAREALQSLSLGASAFGGTGTPEASTITGALSMIEPILDQVSVSINGKSHTMYGFAVRETFPVGTCIENLFVDPNFPPPPGECTSPDFGAFLVLWESHAANERPDRLILVGTDEGRTDYSYDTMDPLVTSSSLAIYVEAPDKLYFSNAGALDTHITSTGQGCSIPIPPYAKSATCNLATFDEAGSIVFELSTDLDTGTGAADRKITIPRQTIHGVWEQITETQPVSLSYTTAIRGLSRQSVQAPLLFSLGKSQRRAQR